MPKRIELAADVKLNPTTGQPGGITPTIMLREPGAEEREHGFIPVDTLLENADQALGEDGKKFWIALDRLDLAFVDSSELVTATRGSQVPRPQNAAAGFTLGNRWKSKTPSIRLLYS